MKHIKRDFRSKACLIPWVNLGVGSKGQSSLFSEHGHVAYQIKENHKCSNMVSNILTHTSNAKCFRNVTLINIRVLAEIIVPVRGYDRHSPKQVMI